MQMYRTFIDDCDSSDLRQKKLPLFYQYSKQIRPPSERNVPEIVDSTEMLRLSYERYFFNIWIILPLGFITVRSKSIGYLRELYIHEIILIILGQLFEYVRSIFDHLFGYVLTDIWQIFDHLVDYRLFDVWRIFNHYYLIDQSCEDQDLPSFE